VGVKKKAKFANTIFMRRPEGKKREKRKKQSFSWVSGPVSVSKGFKGNGPGKDERSGQEGEKRGRKRGGLFCI